MKHTTYNEARELWYVIQHWQRFAWFIKCAYLMPYSYKEKAEKLLELALHLEATIVHEGFNPEYLGFINEAKSIYLVIYKGIDWTR